MGISEVNHVLQWEKWSGERDSDSLMTSWERSRHRKAEFRFLLQCEKIQTLSYWSWFWVKVMQWCCCELNAQLSPDFSPKLCLQHRVPFTIKNSVNLYYAPATVFCGVAVNVTAFYASFWVYFVPCILLIKIKCKRKKDGSWQVKKITPEICQFGLGSPLRIHHTESAVTQTSCLWRAGGRYTWLCGNTNICTFRSPQSI